MQRIEVIDSHTGGEPTRIIVSGGPDLGTGTMAERLVVFRDQFDDIRCAVVNEPRGSDVLVGGLLCEPTQTGSTCGVVFFNNAGFLGMCGHGMIGLMATLKHLGKIENGTHKVETPVGIVEAVVNDDQVSVQNVPSYRLHKNVAVEVPDYGHVVGDVAWGGNWFYLVKNSPESLELENVDHLRRVTLMIRGALGENGITGLDHWIDHVELFGGPKQPGNDSRNFVLCPGGAYDRSPCGTGTSAKLACLAADNELEPGKIWRQESIVGSVFEASYQPDPDNDDRIIPTIRGKAFVTGEASLILNLDDPFCLGIRS